MSKTYAYVRVSGESQATEDRDGVRRQEDACRDLAKRLGREIDAWFHDLGVSGTLNWNDRPAFREMRGLLTRGDVLVVEDIDRVGRDTVQTLIILDDMDRIGVQVFTAKGELKNDPMSKLIRAVIASMAEYQRYMIVERLAAAKAARKRVSPGHKTDGRHRYGHHPQFPQESAGLELILRMDAEGATLKQISEALWAAKIPPRGKITTKGWQSRRWALGSLWEIIQRERNAAAKKEGEAA